MLCIANMNNKKSKQYSRYAQIYGSTVFSYFFLNLGEGERDENYGSYFEILLHFEEAIVAE